MVILIKFMKKFILKKSNKAEDFVCSRCKKQKKSKNIAVSEDGEKLCNGCFGLLLSRKEIIR